MRGVAGAIRPRPFRVRSNLAMIWRFHMQTAFATAAILLGVASASLAQNTYTVTNLVANDAIYEPLNLIDPLLSNGWGIAIRPPGAGGHFWISNAGTGTTTTYVGDVHSQNGRFTPLFQDSLKVVEIPVGSGVKIDGTPVSPVPQTTGQVYNYSSTDFVVSGENITAASKFIFVTGEGTISGWTEFRDANNVLHRQTKSVIMVDQSPLYDDDRLRFTGCAITDFASGNKLYVTNFTDRIVEVYDHLWQRVSIPADRFTYPGQPSDYTPWNVQMFHTGPNGEARLWVAYALREEPWEEDPAFGAIAEFDLDGRFIRRLFTAIDFDKAADSELRAPWGLAIAPPNFGPFGGKMLIANFGDGTIAVYDLVSGLFVDFLRDNLGRALSVDGVWGLTFGNGVALGDSNALYFAAGPNVELDGAFGTIRFTPDTFPTINDPPTSVRLCAGEVNATLSVNAPNPVRVHLQWQREISPGTWVNLSDGPLDGLGEISGSDTDHLFIEGAQGPATLRVLVSNDAGSLESTVVTLTLCAADFNCDGFINGDDYDSFATAFEAADLSADLNRDGFVNGDDYDAFAGSFELGC